MKPLSHISVLLVMASALLASCSILDSSSYEGNPYMGNRVYNGSYNVPAEGGVFEFNCANDRFFISKIFDSFMLGADRLEPVDDLTYEGPFYTITCDNDKHNWVIKVDPLMVMSGESNVREVRVSMWDGSDNSYFVFRFEQSCDEELDYNR